MSVPQAPDASPPLASVDELNRYFLDGAKPVAQWRIGLEQEKVAVSPSGGVIAFEGPAGIEELLRRLEKRGYEGIREDGHLLGLDRHSDGISIEPGGQVEMAGPPLSTVTECRDGLLAHLREVQAVGRDLGMRLLGVGLSPWATLDQLPWLPKRRYAVMRRYLPTRGRLAHAMMKTTATVQVNMDYDDERTAAEKLRTAFGVTSIVTALVAASPLTEGRPNGYRSARAAIWLETDEDRCGLLPFVFEERPIFRSYAEWALDVPMFFVVRDGVYHPGDGMTFRRFMRDGWRDERATIRDWEIHLSTVFPEVRLKRYIEMRGADAAPLPVAVGLAALWRGLVDNRDACRAAWALVAKADMSEREALRRSVPKVGLDGRFMGRRLRDLAVELCDIARAGLARLPGGTADTVLLEPLRSLAAAGRCPADDMLDDYRSLNGDPARLVERWELKPQDLEREPPARLES